jgi:hypothetical protein
MTRLLICDKYWASKYTTSLPVSYNAVCPITKTVFWKSSRLLPLLRLKRSLMKHMPRVCKFIGSVIIFIICDINLMLRHIAKKRSSRATGYFSTGERGRKSRAGAVGIIRCVCIIRWECTIRCAYIAQCEFRNGES